MKKCPKCGRIYADTVIVSPCCKVKLDNESNEKGYVSGYLTPLRGVLLVVGIIELMVLGYLAGAKQLSGDIENADVGDSTIQTGKSDDVEQGDFEEVKEEDSDETTGDANTVKLSCGAELSLDATVAYLNDYQVDSVKELTQFSDLEELYINGGDLNDISPLKELNHLKIVEFHQIPLDDISPLIELPELEKVSITDTHVSADNVDYFLENTVSDVAVHGYAVQEYQIIKGDYSWTDAKERCVAAGGHLATITSEEEFQTIINMTNDTSLKYFWLGGYSKDGEWRWVGKEPWTWNDHWYPGEPSGKDTVDNVKENRLCLWLVEGEWSLNDQRDNLQELSYTKGKMGYVLEKDRVAGYIE